MSEKKVGKRLLTWVLVLVMTLSLLPLNVLADEIPETDNTPGKVTATKSCTTEPDEHGNYTITLTVRGEPVSSTESMTTPANADVVLVVDNSGSMETSVGEPCNEPKEHFEKRDYTVWGTGLIVYKCKSCSTKYYEWNQDGNPRPGVPDNCTGEKGETPRITAAKQVSKEFASSILSYEGNRVAVIGFAHGGRSGGTDSKAIKVSQDLTNNIDSINNVIDSMEADGGTNYTAALQKACDYLNNRPVKDGRPGYVIFISDGAPGLSGESQADPKWNGSEQAEKIKDAGYTLYTVGIALDGSAKTYLKSMASADQNEHFINVTGNDYADRLSTVLKQWADKIKVTPTTKPAGTGAVLTDLINTNDFEYVAGSASPNLKVEDNKTVTWEIGNIPKDEASVNFKIKARAGVYGKDILTNDDVYLKYTDATGAEVTMGKNVIGDPTVNIPAPQVTLTFDANGGAWESAVTGYTMGTDNKTASVTGEVGTLTLQKIGTDPVNAGHDFTGWYQDPECTTPVSWFYQIPLRADATLYAGWTPRQAEEFSCTIRQHFVDLTGESIIPPFTATAVAAGTPIADLIAAYASNQTWDEQNYWYDESQTTVNGSAVTENQTLTEDSIIDLYYYLDTWNDEMNSTTEGDRIPDMYQAVVKFVSGNPLFGKVEGSNCTQVFTLTDSDENYAVSGFVTPSLDGVEATPLNAAVHRFSMWTKNSGEESVKPTEPTTVNGGSTTVFKAQFEKIPTTYTVTYTDGVDGEEIFADKVNRDLHYNDPTPNFGSDPTRDGYTFAGWEPTVANEVIGNATYVAQWEPKAATIKFVTNGGSDVKDMTGKTGDAISSRTMPTTAKSDYTFAGWYANAEFSGTAVTQLPAAFPAGTTTYYAKWNTNYVPYYPPVPPTVKIEDDDALGLNTTDHFAYIVGYGNGEVRPQNNITRAEVATIFFRLLTDDVRDENLTKTNRYSDVAATSWYNTAVSTLSSMGIITGYPDGTFRPNAAITRAEFAAIAARFDNDGDKTAAKFSDIATHWAKDEISIAYNNGWITGYPNGTFGPQRDITRAETMTLVNRVLNRQPETEDVLLPIMTVWTDNANPKAWYYLAVQEATNSHYYKFKTNSKYEKWTELRETRDWTLLEK